MFCLISHSPAARFCARLWKAPKGLAVPASLLCLFALLIAGCATVPGTDRTQLMLLSPSQEVALGTEFFAQYMDENQDKVIRSGPDAEMIERVGRRIVAAAEPMLAERNFQELEWEFHLVDSEVANAFVVPGGKVVFYKGILPICGDENGVAAVMGHEVAHVVARHGGERISQGLLTSVGFAAVQISLRNRDPQTQQAVIGALGAGASLGIILPYSRRHESEADHIGVMLAADAGYDPRAAIAVWHRMDAAHKDRPPAFLATHPDPRRRARDLERLMPEAIARYEAAKTRMAEPAQ